MKGKARLAQGSGRRRFLLAAAALAISPATRATEMGPKLLELVKTLVPGLKLPRELLARADEVFE